MNLCQGQYQRLLRRCLLETDIRGRAVRLGGSPRRRSGSWARIEWCKTIGWPGVLTCDSTGLGGTTFNHSALGPVKQTKFSVSKRGPVIRPWTMQVSYTIDISLRVHRTSPSGLTTNHKPHPRCSWTRAGESWGKDHQWSFIYFPSLISCCEVQSSTALVFAQKAGKNQQENDGEPNNKKLTSSGLKHIPDCGYASSK